MAVLTWRNVDAPNFGSAVDGIRTASMLLNNATETARQGIRDFTKSREEAGDRALLDYVQGIQDPTAMTQALANDPRLRELRQRASVEAIRGLDARPGDLIERAIQDENLTNEQFKNRQYRSGVESVNNHGEIINRAVLAAQRGDFAAANSALSGLGGSLRPDVLARILGTANEVGSAGLRNQQDAWQFGNDQRSDKEAREAQALAMRIASDSPTVADAVAYLDASGVSPQVRAQALRQLQGLGFSGMYAPVGSGGGTVPGGIAAPTSGSGSGGFAAAIPYTETRNYVANIRSRVGNVTGTNEEKAAAIWDALEMQESGGRQFNDDGSVLRSNRGAGGVSQLMPATAREMERKLGMEVGETDRDPAANRRAGQAYFKQMLDKYDGDVDYALAAYNAGPGTVDRWRREGIGQGDPSSAIVEAAKTSAALDARTANNQTLLNQSLSRIRSGNISGNLDRLASDTDSTPLDVAQRLIQSKAIGEEDAGQVMSAINYLMRESGGRISPAIAGEIIRQNLVQADNPVVRTGSIIADVIGTPFGRRTRTSNLSNGLRINDEGVYAQVEAYLNRGTNMQAAAGRNLEAERAVLNRLQQQYESAEATYQIMRSAAVGRSPAYQQAIERYRLQRDRAWEALNQANAQLEYLDRSGGLLQFDTTKPEPVAVTAAGEPVQSPQSEQPVQSDRGHASVDLPGGAFIWYRPPGGQSR